MCVAIKQLDVLVWAANREGVSTRHCKEQQNDPFGQRLYTVATLSNYHST